MKEKKNAKGRGESTITKLEIRANIFRGTEAFSRALFFLVNRTNPKKKERRDRLKMNTK